MNDSNTRLALGISGGFIACLIAATIITFVMPRPIPAPSATPTNPPTLAIMTPATGAIATSVAENRVILRDLSTAVAAQATDAAGSRLATWAAAQRTREAEQP